jgi:hypothetical protein
MGRQKTLRKSISKKTKDRVRELNRDLCQLVALEGIIGFLLDSKELSEEDRKTDRLANAQNYLAFNITMLETERIALVEQANTIQSGGD